MRLPPRAKLEVDLFGFWLFVIFGLGGIHFTFAGELPGQLQIFAPPAAINSCPVSLVIDTGSGGNFLVADTARSLASILVLNVSPSTDPPSKGEVNIAGTTHCKLAFLNSEDDQLFYILDFKQLPPPNRIDGGIGWPLLKKRAFSIDAVNLRVSFGEKPPRMTKEWLKLRLSPASEGLYAVLPGKAGFVLFDTGAVNGVYLTSEGWKKWKKANPTAPLTIEDQGYYVGGNRLALESWAHKLSLGPIVITETPVGSCDAFVKDPAGPSGVVASLGLAAMRRLEIYVDGPGGWIYLRPRHTPPLPYQHNRAGVAFTYTETPDSHLLARVAPGSPAWAAGIRDGDKLVEVDDSAPSQPNLELVDRSDKPNVELTLQRGGVQYRTSFVVRDILGPNTPELISDKQKSELRKAK